MMTQLQYDHLEEHEEEFFKLMGERTRSLDAYLDEYSYKDDLYYRLCSDLDLDPLDDD